VFVPGNHKPGLTQKYYTRLERLARNKYIFISVEEKRFYKVSTCG